MTVYGDTPVYSASIDTEFENFMQNVKVFLGHHVLAIKRVKNCLKGCHEASVEY